MSPPYGGVQARATWALAADDCKPVGRAHDELSLKERAHKVEESLTLYSGFYGEAECQQIEQFVDATAIGVAAGHFHAPGTVDPTPHRTKYFFGIGYTYGSGSGKEELIPEGTVDPIPTWLEQLVIAPLVQKGMVPRGWVDSAVMNDYRLGGSIVAHVDPPQLFARPIFAASFFCPAQLVFGASFDPERRKPPVYSQPMPRGSVLSMDGYAADCETHGMRPEDMFGTRRVSIVLRHVLQEAPRVGLKSHGERQDINEADRSALIRQVQGRWRDPSSRYFYEVRHLKVFVSEIQDGDQEPTRKATWRLAPREHGLVCNRGLLAPDGVSPGRLEWSPLRRTSSDVTWVWLSADVA